MDIAQLRSALSATDDPTARAILRMLDALVDNPERIRALIEMADSLLMLEGDFDRDERKRSFPAPANETLLWPINCPTRRQARQRDEPVPECRWRRDASGYTCQQCARWEGEQTGNGEWIGKCFDAARRGLE